jgi:hypothetical protein
MWFFKIGKEILHHLLLSKRLCSLTVQTLWVKKLLNPIFLSPYQTVNIRPESPPEESQENVFPPVAVEESVQEAIVHLGLELFIPSIHSQTLAPSEATG